MPRRRDFANAAIEAVGRRARYAAGGGGGGLGGLGGGGLGGLGGGMGQPISGYGRPDGGVRADHPTPTGLLPRRVDLHARLSIALISSFNSRARKLFQYIFSHQ
jgi:hypothetical protein